MGNKENENDDWIQRGHEMRKKMEMMMGDREVIGNTKENKNDDGILEKLVHIIRITKVVKGGRRFGFSAFSASI